MKRLTLVRHANAEWDSANMPDVARPLNRRGRHEAAFMARRLVELQLIPELLLVSPASRTQHTAEIFATAFKLPERCLKTDERLYLARPENILRVIAETGARVEHLMVVGHNPGISQLARELSGRHEVETLSTGAVCSIALEAEAWSDVDVAAVGDVVIEAPRMS